MVAVSLRLAQVRGHHDRHSGNGRPMATYVAKDPIHQVRSDRESEELGEAACVDTGGMKFH